MTDTTGIKALREACEILNDHGYLTKSGKIRSSNLAEAVRMIIEQSVGYADQLEAERQRVAEITEQYVDRTTALSFATQRAEAAEKSNAFLKAELAQQANFNPDWDMLEACRENWREVVALLKEREAEIAALKPNMLVMPDGLHPDTKALVLVFASAMAVKLHKAEKKYGYNNSWKNDNWQRECQRDLLAHVNKGDPLDVANYCAFMHYHGWSTAVKGE